MGISWRVLQLDDGTERFLPLAKRLVSSKISAHDVAANQLKAGPAIDDVAWGGFTSVWMLDGVTIRARVSFFEAVGWVAKLSLTGGGLRQAAKLAYGLLTKDIVVRVTPATTGPSEYLSVLINPPGRYTSPLTWRFIDPQTGTEWGSDSGTLFTDSEGRQTWNNYFAVAGILNGTSGFPGASLSITSVYSTPAYLNAFSAYLASSPPAVPSKLAVLTQDQILGYFSGSPTTTALLEGWSGGNYMQSWDLTEVSPGVMKWLPGETLPLAVPPDARMPSGMGDYPLLMSGGTYAGYPYVVTAAIRDAWLAGWQTGLIRADEWDRTVAASHISLLDAGVMPPTIHNALKSAMWYSDRVVIKSPELEVTVFDVVDVGGDYPGSGDHVRTQTHKTRFKFLLLPEDDPAFDPDVHKIEQVVVSSLVEEWTTHIITGDLLFAGTVVLKQTFTDWVLADESGRSPQYSSVPSESAAVFVGEGPATRSSALFEVYNGVCYRFYDTYGPPDTPLDFLSSSQTWGGGTVSPPLPIFPMLYRAYGEFSFLAPSTVQCAPVDAFAKFQKYRKARDVEVATSPGYLDTRPYNEVTFTLFYIDTPVYDPDVDLEANPELLNATLLRAYRMRLSKTGAYTYLGRYTVLEEGEKITLSRGFYADMLSSAPFTPSMIKEFKNHAPDEQPILAPLKSWLGALVPP